MVKITKNGKELRLSFSKEEAGELLLSPEKEYEFSRAKEGIWLITQIPESAVPALPKEQEPVSKIPADDTEFKIMEMIRKLAPKDRMEGWFEKKLSPPEREKFAQMLSEGKVAKYKSNESFRTSLYVPGKTAPAQNARFENKEKPAHEYTLEKDGFMIVKNELNAKSLSEQLREKIKAGEIKGIRTFTGEFYVIKTELLEESEKQVLAELMKQKQGIAPISEKIKLTPTLVKICCEFLKDEGQIMEKTKEIYQYID